MNLYPLLNLLVNLLLPFLVAAISTPTQAGPKEMWRKIWYFLIESWL